MASALESFDGLCTLVSSGISEVQKLGGTRSVLVLFYDRERRHYDQSNDPQVTGNEIGAIS